MSVLSSEVVRLQIGDALSVWGRFVAVCRAVFEVGSKLQPRA